MTRIAFALAVSALLAAAATPAHAIKFYKGKNGNNITCTWDDCNAHCSKTGGKPSQCPSYCTKAINDRKASGECK